MLDILKYYKNMVLSVVKNEFLNPTEVQEEFNKLDDEEQKSFLNLEKNKKRIINYINIINRQNDKVDDKFVLSSSDLETSASNDEEEKFIENILKHLKLDKYSLSDWIPMGELVVAINEFTKEKNNIIQQTQNETKELKDDYEWPEAREIPDIEFEEEAEDSAVRLASELLNTDRRFWTSWFFDEQIDSDDKWLLDPKGIIEVVKKAAANNNKLVTNQLLKLTGGINSQELIKQMDSSSEEREKIQTQFMHNLYIKLKSWIDLQSYLEWNPTSVKESTDKQIDKKWLSTRMKEKVAEIDGELAKDPENEELKLQRQQILNVIRSLPSIDMWLLIKNWEVQAWWTSLSIDTSNLTNWIIPAVRLWAWTDWKWFTLALSAWIPIYNSDKWKVNANWWVDIAWWIFWWISVSREIWEWTTSKEFSSIIDGNWKIDFDKIKSDKNIVLWAWGRVWVATWWVNWAVGWSFERDFKEPIQKVLIWFQKFLSDNPRLNQTVKISELSWIIDGLNWDPNVKKFVENQVNALKSWTESYNDLPVNIWSALENIFAYELNKSAQNYGWHISEIWVWWIFMNWGIAPAVFGKVSKFEADYKATWETVSWGRETVEAKTIEQMVSKLNNEGIEWVTFQKTNDNNVRIIDETWDINKILRKVWVCAKEWFVWKDGRWIIIANNKIRIEHWKQTYIMVWDATMDDLITPNKAKELTNTIKSVWTSESQPSTTSEGLNLKEFSTNEIVSQFITQNILKFQWIRQANKENYVSFNENLNDWNFEKAKSNLLEIIKKVKFQWKDNLIQALNGLTNQKDLAIALAQIKNAMMIDREIAAWLNKDLTSYNKDRLVKVLEKRIQSHEVEFTDWTKEEWTYFQVGFWDKLDTNKYLEYEKEIIGELKGSQWISQTPLNNMFSVIATYPKWVDYLWMDLMPPWVATALWWKTIEIQKDQDKTNTDYITTKISNSVYWEEIVKQIANTTGVKLERYELTSLLRWDEINWVKIDTKFYAFLNWRCANESLWMEITWFSVKKKWKEVKFSYETNYGIWENKSTLWERSIWLWVAVESREEASKPTIKPTEKPRHNRPKTEVHTDTWHEDVSWTDVDTSVSGVDWLDTADIKPTPTGDEITLPDWE